MQSRNVGQIGAFYTSIHTVSILFRLIARHISHITDSTLRVHKKHDQLMLNGEMVAAYYKNQDNSQIHSVPNAALVACFSHLDYNN